ncbi:C40 family peptidase [Cognatitamlana onchidii]|uniref:C40 family peptidase n=1 Tax=Cognatitamlana onchidii TaxID=2562860 RepID=UPI0010A60113|nr:C40 family peptidase [Algibacter onchidii]
MKKTLIILILGSCLLACKASRKSGRKQKNRVEVVQKNSTQESNKIADKKKAKKKKETPKSQADQIIDYAKQFEGVRYKWGGTTKSGMDCSGLVYESFKTYDITLPRISRDMAKKGKKVSLKKVLRGDLLFFKTGNRRNSINHVGLIVAIRNNDIEFIHATSSKGVIVSHLNETYWLKAFHEARRIL